MLTVEKFRLHGFPLLQKWNVGYNLPIDFLSLLFGSISNSEMQCMVGLGWHGGSAGPVRIYILASFELWSDHTKIRHTPCMERVGNGKANKHGDDESDEKTQLQYYTPLHHWKVQLACTNISPILDGVPIEMPARHGAWSGHLRGTLPFDDLARGQEILKTVFICCHCFSFLSRH